MTPLPHKQEQEVVDDVVHWLAVLRGQSFRDPALALEQKILSQLLLQVLWHLCNNAFQGDGQAFLDRQQSMLLQHLDASLAHGEGEIPPPIRRQIHACVTQLMAAVDTYHGD